MAKVVHLDFSARQDTIDRQSLLDRGFTTKDIKVAEKFGKPHAALYNYLYDKENKRNENAVMTPKGQGTIHQVFSDRCLVLLTRGKPSQKYRGGKMWKPMEAFDPSEVRPA